MPGAFWSLEILKSNHLQQHGYIHIYTLILRQTFPACCRWLPSHSILSNTKMKPFNIKDIFLNFYNHYELLPSFCQAPRGKPERGKLLEAPMHTWLHVHVLLPSCNLTQVRGWQGERVMWHAGFSIRQYRYCASSPPWASDCTIFGSYRWPGWCKTAVPVNSMFVALSELYWTKKSTLAKLSSCTHTFQSEDMASALKAFSDAKKKRKKVN